MNDQHAPSSTPNPLHAACALFAASLGAAAASLDAGPPPLVAAISPAEAQAWIDLLIATVNKLFTLINVGVGVWQSFELARHRRRSKRHPSGPPGPPVGPPGGADPKGPLNGRPTPAPGG